MYLQWPYWNLKSSSSLKIQCRCLIWRLWNIAILYLYQGVWARHSTWDPAFTGRQVVSDFRGKMSPTDAKRGAKRRKNKRGGGSSCSTVCSTSGKAGVSATALSPQSTATPSVLGFLTSGSTGNGNIGSITGMNGEVRMLQSTASAWKHKTSARDCY